MGNLSLKGHGFRKVFLKYVTSLMSTVFFFTLNAFNTLYELNISFLEYYGVINSINAYLRKTNLNKTETNILLDDSPIQRKLLYPNRIKNILLNTYIF